MIMDTDGPTLMCLADHLTTASYNAVHVGVLQPMQAFTVKGTAAMAALACVIRALKTCYHLEMLSVTFQLNYEEAQQAMSSQLPPVPKPIIEVGWKVAYRRCETGTTSMLVFRGTW